jgi:Ca2+-binding EF-hand superfamily protein
MLKSGFKPLLSQMQLVPRYNTVEEQVAEFVADLSIWDMDAGQLSEFALDLFMQYDVDKSGGLDRKEFKAVLTSTAGLCKLNAVDPELESAWFQPSSLCSEKVKTRFQAFAFECNVYRYTTALGFTSKEVREIMAESDANDDGVVDYKEFLPLMIELIGAMKAKQAAKAARAAEQEEQREAVVGLNKV